MTDPTKKKIDIHRLTLHNTGRMTVDETIASFVARRREFERIIADIAAETPGSRPQHHLLVGQRGMGKTMLLARIAAEINRRPDLDRTFIALTFPEEQYAVDRLSKFWLNCLDSLADACERRGDPESAAAIDGAVDHLTSTSDRRDRDDRLFAESAFRALEFAAASLKKRPVLLVDNLQLVFERISKDQQHELREILMRPAAPIVVGSSPFVPPETTDYTAPFFDHFKNQYLRPLGDDEMRELLLHLAHVSERNDVRSRVLANPARLMVLRQLTGGNPRTVVALFFLYTEDFAPDVFGDLVGLLDRVTPLFKARFEELAPQQQIVASAVADHWDPVTASKLAETTRLPIATISSQLDRLEKSGVIERVELFGESRMGFQIAERFFNIWYLMRNAPRRKRRDIEDLVRFMQRFHETSAAATKPTTRESVSDFGEGEAADSRRSVNPHTIPLADFTTTDNIAEAVAERRKWSDTTELSWSDIENWIIATALIAHSRERLVGGTLRESETGRSTPTPMNAAEMAHAIGDRRALRNVAPEVRPIAEWFFDEIDKVRRRLPESVPDRKASAVKKTRSRPKRWT